MSTPVEELARRSKTASRHLTTASTDEKNAALLAAADLMLERSADVLGANADDLRSAESDGMEAGPLDRLRLTEDRLEGMADGLRKVAALPDPVGEVLEEWTRPNGLRIERVRVPLGVVAIIYENRPNVTSDAAGLCLKAGNAALAAGIRDRAALERRDHRGAARSAPEIRAPRRRRPRGRRRIP